MADLPTYKFLGFHVLLFLELIDVIGRDTPARHFELDDICNTSGFSLTGLFSLFAAKLDTLRLTP